MKTFIVSLVSAIWYTLLACTPAPAEVPADDRLKLMDVFNLEYASDPQVSPDGTRVAYVRNFMDIMKDKPRSHLWIINVDGTDHRPLTTGNGNESSPRWSPDGKRLCYVGDADGKDQLFCRWMDNGQTAQLRHAGPGQPVLVVGWK